LKKVVYSLEQMQNLSRLINALTVTGLDNFRIITAAASIIDDPIQEIIDEIGDDENGQSEHKAD
jgi:hypothetical protein